MMRQAVRAAPQWYAQHDWLAWAFWLYGLEHEARQEVRQAARVLPLYGPHSFGRRYPDWVVEEFAEASRDVLGDVPLVSRTVHLIDLGKLELSRGAYEAAAATLEEALAEGLDDLGRAETHFNLGLALLGLGSRTRAEDHLRQSAEHPVFRTAALLNLAISAEQVGDYESALRDLRTLRRQEPKNLDYCLRFARVATRLEDWDAALEALRWATLVHPSDPVPQVALVELHLDMGDLPAASKALWELEEWVSVEGSDPELDQRIEILKRLLDVGL
jgi:tetratricopeptide (TPR) repeat protein